MQRRCRNRLFDFASCIVNLGRIQKHSFVLRIKLRRKDRWRDDIYNEDIGKRVIILTGGVTNCHLFFSWFVKYAYRRKGLINYLYVLQPKSAKKHGSDSSRPTGTFVGYPWLLTGFQWILRGGGKVRAVAEAIGVMASKTEGLAHSSVAEAVPHRQANLIAVGSRDTSTSRWTPLGDFTISSNTFWSTCPEPYTLDP